MNKEKAKVHYSHNTDHWATPSDIYKKYMDEGYIDPCPLHCEEDNRQKMYIDKKIFINPPYSDIENWVQFIKNNIKNNKEIHLLIPARTDTNYFHELLLLKPTIIFIKGRLKFNDKGCAPFPSIIMKFNYFNIFPIYTYETNKNLSNTKI